MEYYSYTKLLKNTTPYAKLDDFTRQEIQNNTTDIYLLVNKKGKQSLKSLTSINHYTQFNSGDIYRTKSSLSPYNRIAYPITINNQGFYTVTPVNHGIYDDTPIINLTSHQHFMGILFQNDKHHISYLIEAFNQSLLHKLHHKETPTHLFMNYNKKMHDNRPLEAVLIEEWANNNE